MRVWRGAVFEQEPPLGTVWACVHCCGEFKGPVAAELGRRRCRMHPETTGACCGRLSLDPGRGCRRCDHVPAAVWQQALGPARDLYVPAYTLPSDVGGATAVARDAVPVAYRGALEARARLEKGWWASLPPEVTKPLLAQAQEDSERYAEATSRDYAFTPFVASPEEQARKFNGRPGAAATADASPVVEFLVRSAGDTFAWEAAPTSRVSKAMARSLRAWAVDWVFIPLIAPK